MLDDLKSNFLTKFKELIDELFTGMDDKERHSVVWRAIHQKEEFFEETENLKNVLSSALSEI